MSKDTAAISNSSKESSLTKRFALLSFVRIGILTKERQKRQLKMQSEVIGSQRMAVMGEMAAAVAHGIGNPLASIRAAAQF